MLLLQTSVQCLYWGTRCAPTQCLIPRLTAFWCPFLQLPRCSDEGSRVKLSSKSLLPFTAPRRCHRQGRVRELQSWRVCGVTQVVGEGGFIYCFSCICPLQPIQSLSKLLISKARNLARSHVLCFLREQIKRGGWVGEHGCLRHPLPRCVLRGWLVRCIVQECQGTGVIQGIIYNWCA